MTRPVAIVGCGLIGTKRALNLPLHMSIASVADVSEIRARALAEICSGEPKVAATASDAFAEASGGLAVVATSHDSLASVATLALEAGLDVLIEKPGARSLGELIEVRRAAEQAGRKVRVGFNHRFHPSFERIREIVAAENCGRLMHVRARYGHGGRIGYEQEWRADRRQSGGGELLDQGVHLIDLTRSFAGEVDLAFAELQTQFWDMEVEDNAFVALRCERGAFAWLHASWTEWKNMFSFELAYEHMKFDVAGLGGSYGTERLSVYRMRPEMGPPDTIVNEWPRGDTSWAGEMNDVSAYLDGNQYFGATIDDAIAVMTVVEEAYRT